MALSLPAYCCGAATYAGSPDCTHRVLNVPHVTTQLQISKGWQSQPPCFWYAQVAALQEQHPALVACGYMAFVQDATIDAAVPAADAGAAGGQPPGSQQPGSQPVSSQGAVAAEGGTSADGHHIPRWARPAMPICLPHLPNSSVFKM